MFVPFPLQRKTPQEYAVAADAARIFGPFAFGIVRLRLPLRAALLAEQGQRVPFAQRHGRIGKMQRLRNGILFRHLQQDNLTLVASPACLLPIRKKRCPSRALARFPRLTRTRPSGRTCTTLPPS